MERYCSTGQSPQRAIAPTEEEEEEKEEEEGFLNDVKGSGGGLFACTVRAFAWRD
jgi:hypothetical protein